MKLPNADRAIVDETKVRDYLLSPEHPVGRFKARVFRAAGYRREEWQRLQNDLRLLARIVDVRQDGDVRFGQRFVGAGPLQTPTGRLLPVVTVWLIPSPGHAPRLITAYPADEP
jgi:hypothetical protein